MGKIENFAIYLNRPNFSYLPGEHVNGILKFRLNKKTNIRSIKINLYGGARVHWEEEGNSDSDGNRTTYSYSANEIYLNLDIYLVAKNDSNSYFEQNEYNFPFNFVLPNYLPYSFHHSNGKIDYVLTGVIDIPFSFDIKTKLPINIGHLFDLNSNPSLRHGYGITEQKFACCGPCKTDPIIITFSTYKCGYVPGQSIRFNVSLENFSSRKLDKVEVKLRQVCCFNANFNKSTCSPKEISSVLLAASIESNEKKAWNDVELVIPIVPPSLNGHIIEINYKLVLSFKTSSLSFAKEAAIEIVIGTIPFVDTITSIDSNPPSYDQMFKNQKY